MNHQERCAIPITWKEGDTIKVDGEEGKVGYVYNNGYTLVFFPDTLVKGGIFNNDSTFGNERICKI